MVKNKILWLDTETLSFDVNEPDIIQLAGIIEINGKIEKTFNYLIKPIYNPEKVEIGIWDFHQQHLGKSKDQILNEFDNNQEVFIKFRNLLKSYIDPYDKKDRFILGGYNCQFDKGKLSSWFNYYNDKFLFSLLSGRMFDVFHILSYILADQKFSSFKLEDVWKYMVSLGLVKEFKGNQHSAVTDIKQTYILWKKICEPFRES